MNAKKLKRITESVKIMAEETDSTEKEVVENLIGVLWSEEEAGQIKYFAEQGFIDESQSDGENPWWYPVLCNKKYFAELRENYPDKSDWNDEDLHEYFNDEKKYSIAWDDIGDAYEEYEKLADAYLELSDHVENAVKLIYELMKSPTVDDDMRREGILLSRELLLSARPKE